MCFFIEMETCVHVCATSVFIVISVQGSEDCVTRFSVNKKQCVTARTNQLMHVDNIIYHKKHRHVNIGLFLLKGQCHEIFDLSVFMYQFPPSPGYEYLFGAVSIFSKIPRNFPQLQVLTGVLTPWQMEKIFNFFLKFTLRCQQSDTVSSFCHRCHWHRWKIYRRCRWYLRPVSGANWFANISTNFEKLRNDHNVIFRGSGEYDSRKKPEVKISKHCPIKWRCSLTNITDET
jgi:hypothetical protein